MRLRPSGMLEAVKPAEDFPILIETWRTCLRDEFDLERLKQVLDEIDDREISLEECSTAAAIAFSHPAWSGSRRTRGMYADGTTTHHGERIGS